MCTVPPAINGFPSHLFLTEGEGFRIEAKVEGHPPPTLVWFHNEEAVVTDYSTGIDEQGSLFFPSIELKHSGVYKVIATNASGQAEKVVTVSVMNEGCDGGEGGGSGETNRPVTVLEFGTFVSKHHSHGNKKFRESYEVGRRVSFFIFTMQYKNFIQRLPNGEAGHTVTVSLNLENDLKNRFKNINVCKLLFTPCLNSMVNKLQFYAGLWIDDDNQLVLQPLTVGKEMFNNEYINASYVDVS